jgi:hypothetical protein
MLRIHLTAEDLAATRLATRPDPLWEVVGSLRTLRDRTSPLLFGGWRRRTWAALAGQARMCLDLVPPQGYCPDFLTPAEGSLGLEAGITAVLATPAAGSGANCSAWPSGRPCRLGLRRLVTGSMRRGKN